MPVMDPASCFSRSSGRDAALGAGAGGLARLFGSGPCSPPKKQYWRGARRCAFFDRWESAREGKARCRDARFYLPYMTNSTKNESSVPEPRFRPRSRIAGHASCGPHISSVQATPQKNSPEQGPFPWICECGWISGSGGTRARLGREGYKPSRLRTLKVRHGRGESRAVDVPGKRESENCFSRTSNSHPQNCRHSRACLGRHIPANPDARALISVARACRTCVEAGLG